MLHDSRQLTEIVSDCVGYDRFLAIATSNALREVGIQSLILWETMFYNTQNMLFSAATDKDAGDVCRTMSAYLEASHRDMGENAEALSRIWRRYCRDVVARTATTPVAVIPVARR